MLERGTVGGLDPAHDVSRGADQPIEPRQLPWRLTWYDPSKLADLNAKGVTNALIDLEIAILSGYDIWNFFNEFKACECCNFLAILKRERSLNYNQLIVTHTHAVFPGGPDDSLPAPTEVICGSRDLP
jgi:hypothetical protein